MDAVQSNKSDRRENSHEAGSVKRKPAVKANGPQFTIPRLKKIKRDLLTDLPLDSHECQQEILPMVRKSFHFQFSHAIHEFTKVQSVYNPELTTKYLERRKDMKSLGYPDPLVSDTYAFVPVDNSAEAEKMCRDGVRCGNQPFSGLGVSHMAVHVCKHADVLTPNKPKYGEKILLVVKVLKGKVKTVLCKNVGAQLEPTPNYDCHIAKPNVDQSTNLPPHMLYYSTQLYLFEYGDFDLEDYPRQVLPYAVVYYRTKDPQQQVDKSKASLPHPPKTTPLPPHSASYSSSSTSSPTIIGPSNEVWRGRLHVRLLEGGHIYIEVTMLSYYVPLTVSLISPIKIHGLYPEHNAQFTFFCGLTNIAEKDEVEWRAHYFRYCVMRPRPSNEEHFKALVKHISAKREMPTVRLPNDVFLFLMPNCLLASQLGVVTREDDSPVLHCIIMSKHSTSESKKKKLAEKKSIFNNYGSARSWEELFDDSDFSDEEEEKSVVKTRKHLTKTLPTVFRDQRSIHNKFAAMSLADADINFTPCACKKFGAAKKQQQYRRDVDVVRVYKAVQAATQSSQKPSAVHFPQGSRHIPKQKMSRRAQAMPSFSPHGSSDSDSDNDSSNGKAPVTKNQDRYSLLSSTKTVEEELSEEELTNEQMEDIIFLRKPALSATSKSKSSGSQSLGSRHTKQSTDSSLKTPVSVPDNKKPAREPPFSAKPKIIPTEPLESVQTKPVAKPKIIPAEPKIIPAEPKIIPIEPVDSSRGPSPSLKKPEMDVPVKLDPKISPVNTLPRTVKPILKSSTTSAPHSQSFKSRKLENNTPPPSSAVPLVENDFGDVDMRVPHQHSTAMHPVFLSAVQPSSLQLRVPHQQQQPRQPVSPNLSFGSWLAPNDLHPPPPSSQSRLIPTSSASSFTTPASSRLHEQSPSPPSPISPPAESPPSPPTESPASPVDSPASPLSPSPDGVDMESPASPPQSAFLEPFRSTPIAIPTSRIKQNASPETSFVYRGSYFPQPTNIRGRPREGIDNADDMKDFLNSGFDSDLDSSYEDESEFKEAPCNVFTTVFHSGHEEHGTLPLKRTTASNERYRQTPASRHDVDQKCLPKIIITSVANHEMIQKSSNIKNLYQDTPLSDTFRYESNVCSHCRLYKTCRKVFNLYLCAGCRFSTQGDPSSFFVEWESGFAGSYVIWSPFTKSFQDLHHANRHICLKPCPKMFSCKRRVTGETNDDDSAKGNEEFRNVEILHEKSSVENDLEQDLISISQAVSQACTNLYKQDLHELQKVQLFGQSQMFDQHVWETCNVMSYPALDISYSSKHELAADVIPPIQSVDIGKAPTDSAYLSAEKTNSQSKMKSGYELESDIFFRHGFLPGTLSSVTVMPLSVNQTPAAFSDEPQSASCTEDSAESKLETPDTEADTQAVKHNMSRTLDEENDHELFSDKTQKKHSYQENQHSTEHVLSSGNDQVGCSGDRCYLNKNLDSDQNVGAQYGNSSVENQHGLSTDKNLYGHSPTKEEHGLLSDKNQHGHSFDVFILKNEDRHSSTDDMIFSKQPDQNSLEPFRTELKEATCQSHPIQEAQIQMDSCSGSNSNNLVAIHEHTFLHCKAGLGLGSLEQTAAPSNAENGGEIVAENEHLETLDVKERTTENCGKLKIGEQFGEPHSPGRIITISDHNSDCMNSELEITKLHERSQLKSSTDNDEKVSIGEPAGNSHYPESYSDISQHPTSTIKGESEGKSERKLHERSQLKSTVESVDRHGMGELAGNFHCSVTQTGTNSIESEPEKMDERNQKSLSVSLIKPVFCTEEDNVGVHVYGIDDTIDISEHGAELPDLRKRLCKRIQPSCPAVFTKPVSSTEKGVDRLYETSTVVDSSESEVDHAEPFGVSTEIDTDSDGLGGKLSEGDKTLLSGGEFVRQSKSHNLTKNWQVVSGDGEEDSTMYDVTTDNDSDPVVNNQHLDQTPNVQTNSVPWQKKFQEKYACQMDSETAAIETSKHTTELGDESRFSYSMSIEYHTGNSQSSNSSFEKKFEKYHASEKVVGKHAKGRNISAAVSTTDADSERTSQEENLEKHAQDINEIERKATDETFLDLTLQEKNGLKGGVMETQTQSGDEVETVPEKCVKQKCADVDKLDEKNCRTWAYSASTDYDTDCSQSGCEGGKRLAGDRVNVAETSLSLTDNVQGIMEIKSHSEKTVLKVCENDCVHRGNSCSLYAVTTDYDSEESQNMMQDLSIEASYQNTTVQDSSTSADETAEAMTVSTFGTNREHSESLEELHDRTVEGKKHSNSNDVTVDHGTLQTTGYDEIGGSLQKLDQNQIGDDSGFHGMSDTVYNNSETSDDVIDKGNWASSEGYVQTTENLASSEGHSQTTGNLASSEGHSQTTRNWTSGEGHSQTTRNWASSEGHSQTTRNWTSGEGHSQTTRNWTSGEGHSQTTRNWTSGEGHSQTTRNWASSEGHSQTTGNLASSEGHSQKTGKLASSEGHSQTTGKLASSEGHSHARKSAGTGDSSSPSDDVTWDIGIVPVTLPQSDCVKCSVTDKSSTCAYSITSSVVMSSSNETNQAFLGADMRQKYFGSEVSNIRNESEALTSVNESKSITIGIHSAPEESPQHTVSFDFEHEKTKGEFFYSKSSDTVNPSECKKRVLLHVKTDAFQRLNSDQNSVTDLFRRHRSTFGKEVSSELCTGKPVVQGTWKTEPVYEDDGAKTNVGSSVCNVEIDSSHLSSLEKGSSTEMYHEKSVASWKMEPVYEDQNQCFVSMESLPEECLIDMDSSDLEDALDDNNGLAHRLDFDSPLIESSQEKRNRPSLFDNLGFDSDADSSAVQRNTMLSSPSSSQGIVNKQQSPQLMSRLLLDSGSQDSSESFVTNNKQSVENIERKEVKFVGFNNDENQALKSPLTGRNLFLDLTSKFFTERVPNTDTSTSSSAVRYTTASSGGVSVAQNKIYLSSEPWKNASKCTETNAQSLKISSHILNTMQVKVESQTERPGCQEVRQQKDFQDLTSKTTKLPNSASTKPLNPAQYSHPANVSLVRSNVKPSCPGSEFPVSGESLSGMSQSTREDKQKRSTSLQSLVSELEDSDSGSSDTESASLKLPHPKSTIAIVSDWGNALEQEVVKQHMLKTMKIEETKQEKHVQTVTIAKSSSSDKHLLRKSLAPFDLFAYSMNGPNSCSLKKENYTVSSSSSSLPKNIPNAYGTSLTLPPLHPASMNVGNASVRQLLLGGNLIASNGSSSYPIGQHPPCMPGMQQLPAIGTIFSRLGQRNSHGQGSFAKSDSLPQHQSSLLPHVEDSNGDRSTFTTSSSDEEMIPRLGATVSNILSNTCLTDSQPRYATASQYQPNIGQRNLNWSSMMNSSMPYTLPRIPSLSQSQPWRLPIQTIPGQQMKYPAGMVGNQFINTDYRFLNTSTPKQAKKRISGNKQKAATFQKAPKQTDTSFSKISSAVMFSGAQPHVLNSTSSNPQTMASECKGDNCLQRKIISGEIPVATVLSDVQSHPLESVCANSQTKANEDRDQQCPPKRRRIVKECSVILTDVNPILEEGSVYLKKVKTDTLKRLGVNLKARKKKNSGQDKGVKRGKKSCPDVRSEILNAQPSVGGLGTQSGMRDLCAQSGAGGLNSQSRSISLDARSGMRCLSTQSGVGSLNAQSGAGGLNTQSGAGGLNAQSGAGGLNAQSGAGGLSAQSGAGGPSAQSGAGGPSAQSGAGGLSAQSGAGGLSAQSGAGSLSAQSGVGFFSVQSRAGASSALSTAGDFSASSDELYAESLQASGIIRLVGSPDRISRIIQVQRNLWQRAQAMAMNPTLPDGQKVNKTPKARKSQSAEKIKSPKPIPKVVIKMSPSQSMSWEICSVSDSSEKINTDSQGKTQSSQRSDATMVEQGMMSGVTKPSKKSGSHKRQLKCKACVAMESTGGTVQNCQQCKKLEKERDLKLEKLRKIRELKRQYACATSGSSSIQVHVVGSVSGSAAGSMSGMSEIPGLALSEKDATVNITDKKEKDVNKSSGELSKKQPAVDKTKRTASKKSSVCDVSKIPYKHQGSEKKHKDLSSDKHKHGSKASHAQTKEHSSSKKKPVLKGNADGTSDKPSSQKICIQAKSTHKGNKSLEGGNSSVLDSSMVLALSATCADSESNKKTPTGLKPENLSTGLNEEEKEKPQHGKKKHSSSHDRDKSQLSSNKKTSHLPADQKKSHSSTDAKKSHSSQVKRHHELADKKHSHMHKDTEKQISSDKQKRPSSSDGHKKPQPHSLDNKKKSSLPDKTQHVSCDDNTKSEVSDSKKRSHFSDAKRKHHSSHDKKKPHSSDKEKSSHSSHNPKPHTLDDKQKSHVPVVKETSHSSDHSKESQKKDKLTKIHENSASSNQLVKLDSEKSHTTSDAEKLQVALGDGRNEVGDHQGSLNRISSTVKIASETKGAGDLVHPSTTKLPELQKSLHKIKTVEKILEKDANKPAENVQLHPVRSSSDIQMSEGLKIFKIPKKSSSQVSCESATSDDNTASVGDKGIQKNREATTSVGKTCSDSFVGPQVGNIHNTFPMVNPPESDARPSVKGAVFGKHGHQSKPSKSFTFKDKVSSDQPSSSLKSVDQTLENDSLASCMRAIELWGKKVGKASEALMPSTDHESDTSGQDLDVCNKKPSQTVRKRVLPVPEDLNTCNKQQSQVSKSALQAANKVVEDKAMAEGKSMILETVKEGKEPLKLNEDSSRKVEFRDGSKSEDSLDKTGLQKMNSSSGFYIDGSDYYGNQAPTTSSLQCRGRGLEEVAEDRRNRRLHPYTRPDRTETNRGGKKYATFDLAYRDLQDLMRCLTTSSFRQSHKTRHVYNQYCMQTPGRRFSQYCFTRSAIPLEEEQEIDPKNLLRPEDILDYEARRRMADMVEELAVSSGVEDAEKHYKEEIQAYCSGDDSEVKTLTTLGYDTEARGGSANIYLTSMGTSSVSQTSSQVPSLDPHLEHCEQPTRPSRVTPDSRVCVLLEDEQPPQGKMESMYQTVDLTGDPDDISLNMDSILVSDEEASFIKRCEDSYNDFEADKKDSDADNTVIEVQDVTVVEEESSSVKKCGTGHEDIKKSNSDEGNSTGKIHSQTTPMLIESTEAKGVEKSINVIVSQSELVTNDQKMGIKHPLVSRNENTEKSESRSKGDGDKTTSRESVFEKRLGQKIPVIQSIVNRDVKEGMIATISDKASSKGCSWNPRLMMKDTNLPVHERLGPAEMKQRDPRLAQVERCLPSGVDSERESCQETRRVILGPHTPPGSPSDLSRFDRQRSGNCVGPHGVLSVKLEAGSGSHSQTVRYVSETGSTQRSFSNENKQTQSGASKPVTENRIDQARRLLPNASHHNINDRLSTIANTPTSSVDTQQLGISNTENSFSSQKGSFSSRFDSQLFAQRHHEPCESMSYGGHPPNSSVNPSSHIFTRQSTVFHSPTINRTDLTPRHSPSSQTPINTFRNDQMQMENANPTATHILSQNSTEIPKDHQQQQPRINTGPTFDKQNDHAQHTADMTTTATDARKSQTEIIRELMNTVSRIQSQIKSHQEASSSQPSPSKHNRGSGADVPLRPTVCTAEADTTFRTPDRVTDKHSDSEKLSESSQARNDYYRSVAQDTPDLIKTEQYDSASLTTSLKQLKEHSSDSEASVLSIQSTDSSFDKREKRIKWLLKAKDTRALSQHEIDELKTMMKQREKDKRKLCSQTTETQSQMRKRKRVTGPHPLRHEKWEHVPVKITIENLKLEYKADPKLEKCGYTLLCFTTYTTRDPRLRPRQKSETDHSSWKKGSVMKSGKEMTIRIVKDIPLEPVEDAQTQSQAPTGTMDLSPTAGCRSENKVSLSVLAEVKEELQKVTDESENASGYSKPELYTTCGREKKAVVGTDADRSVKQHELVGGINLEVINQHLQEEVCQTQSIVAADSTYYDMQENEASTVMPPSTSLTKSSTELELASGVTGGLPSYTGEGDKIHTESEIKEKLSKDSKGTRSTGITEDTLHTESGTEEKSLENSEMKGHLKRNSDIEQKSRTDCEVKLFTNFEKGDGLNADFKLGEDLENKSLNESRVDRLSSLSDELQRDIQEMEELLNEEDIFMSKPGEKFSVDTTANDNIQEDVHNLAAYTCAETKPAERETVEAKALRISSVGGCELSRSSQASSDTSSLGHMNPCHAVDEKDGALKNLTKHRTEISKNVTEDDPQESCKFEECDEKDSGEQVVDKVPIMDKLHLVEPIARSDGESKADMIDGNRFHSTLTFSTPRKSALEEYQSKEQLISGSEKVSPFPLISPKLRDSSPFSSQGRFINKLELFSNSPETASLKRSLLIELYGPRDDSKAERERNLSGSPQDSHQSRSTSPNQFKSLKSFSADSYQTLQHSNPSLHSRGIDRLTSKEERGHGPLFSSASSQEPHYSQCYQTQHHSLSPLFHSELSTVSSKQYLASDVRGDHCVSDYSREASSEDFLRSSFQPVSGDEHSQHSLYHTDHEFSNLPSGLASSVSASNCKSSFGHLYSSVNLQGPEIRTASSKGSPYGDRKDSVGQISTQSKCLLDDSEEEDFSHRLEHILKWGAKMDDPDSYRPKEGSKHDDTDSGRWPQGTELDGSDFFQRSNDTRGRSKNRKKRKRASRRRSNASSKHDILESHSSKLEQLSASADSTDMVREKSLDQISGLGSGISERNEKSIPQTFRRQISSSMDSQSCSPVHSLISQSSSVGKVIISGQPCEQSRSPRHAGLQPESVSSTGSHRSRSPGAGSRSRSPSHYNRSQSPFHRRVFRAGRASRSPSHSLKSPTREVHSRTHKSRSPCHRSKSPLYVSRSHRGRSRSPHQSSSHRSRSPQWKKSNAGCKSRSPLYGLGSSSHKSSRSPHREPRFPRHKPKSPLHTSRSPRHKSKSPYRGPRSPSHRSTSSYRVRSPNYKARSPFHGLQSLNRRYRSPRHKSKSPLHGQRSPGCKPQSPTRKRKSEHHSLRSPSRKQRCLNNKSRSPGQNSKTSRYKSKSGQEDESYRHTLISEGDKSRSPCHNSKYPSHQKQRQKVTFGDSALSSKDLRHQIKRSDIRSRFRYSLSPYRSGDEITPNSLDTSFGKCTRTSKTSNIDRTVIEIDDSDNESLDSKYLQNNGSQSEWLQEISFGQSTFMSGEYHSQRSSLMSFGGLSSVSRELPRPVQQNGGDQQMVRKIPPNFSGQGVIASTTSALLNFKALLSLMMKLEELSKTGLKWVIDVHAKSICDMDDLRKSYKPASPEFVEVERCLALVNKYNLEGVLKVVRNCVCRKQPSMEIKDLVICSLARKQPRDRVILLIGPVEGERKAELEASHPLVSFAEIQDIEGMLPNPDSKKQH